jgi:hypothetical protein
MIGSITVTAKKKGTRSALFVDNILGQRGLLDLFGITRAAIPSCLLGADAWVRFKSRQIV